MPNSNFDNQLHEQLSGYQAPYNPEDWDRMAAMLDQDKRRSGLFIWFLSSGLMLIFMVAAGFYYAGSHGTLNTDGVINTASAATFYHAKNDLDNATAVASNGLLLAEENNTADADCEEYTVNENETVPTDNSNSEEDGQKGSSKLRMATLNNSTENNTSSNAVTPSVKTGITTNSAGTSSLTLTTTSLPEVDEEEEETGSLALAYIPSEEIEAGLLIDPTAKTDSTSKLKIKSSSSVRGILEAYGGIQSTFVTRIAITKPGYTTGINIGFVVNNRFSLTTGIGYNRMNMEYIDLPCEDGQICADAITHQADLITIPLDFKVNIVRKPRFNFFLATGFTNYIKMRESFDYELPEPPPPTNVTTGTPPPSLDDVQGLNEAVYDFVSSNLSASGLDEAFAFDQGNGGFDPTIGALEEFKANENPIYYRYFIDYHLSAGVEYLFTDRLSMLYEPGFMVTIPTNGNYQQAIKGVTMQARLRWYFGK